MSVGGLAGVMPASSTRRTWTLTIAAPADPKDPTKAWWANLNNDRGDHAMVAYRRTNAWRKATRQAAIVAGIATLGGAPRVILQRARLDVEYRFLRRARGGVRRDITTNWAPTQKAIVDTLTADGRRVPKIPSVGVIVDDAPRYLCCASCPHATIGDPIEPGPCAPLGLVVLTITDLSGVPDAS